jgi:methionyl-tRNA formyltransferase
MGGPLIEETVLGLSTGALTARQQPEDATEKQAPKLTKENTQIDLDLSASEFINLIRSLCPYPGAKALIKEDRQETVIKLLEVGLASHKTIEKNHLLIEGSRIYLGLKHDSVELLRWQFPSKKPISVKDFLNGYSLKTPVFMFSTL